jgi:hypothetical protein
MSKASKSHERLGNSNSQCRQSVEIRVPRAKEPVEAQVEFNLKDLALDGPECEPTFPDHLESVCRWSHVGRHGSAAELRDQADMENERGGVDNLSV